MWTLIGFNEISPNGKHPYWSERLQYKYTIQPPAHFHLPLSSGGRRDPASTRLRIIIKQSLKSCGLFRVQELCESRGGRPALPVPNSPCGFCGRKATLKLNLLPLSELRSCVKVEVAVLCSPSLIVLVVSVDVKQHWNWTYYHYQSSGAVWKSRNPWFLWT